MSVKEHKKILLAHGSGGRLTHELIENLFKKKFSNDVLNILDDSAEIKLKLNKNERIAYTTDSFVVNPLFFPGGDIGKLSICGTVNDLAMKGAVPVALAVSAILEEGLEIEQLKKIVDSINVAARKAGVKIIAGDTKVVEKGKADKIFITTTGIGIIKKDRYVSGANAKINNDIIINGSIGDHGIAVLCARNDFKLRSKIISDCSCLNSLVEKMFSVSVKINVLRDPTRGGVATTLNEIAKSSDIGIIINEQAIPLKKAVKSVCGMLGLDPLYIANEGKLLAFTEKMDTGVILKKMKKDPLGKQAVKIGETVKNPKGVWLKTTEGGIRPLIMLEGDQLPRIC